MYTRRFFISALPAFTIAGCMSGAVRKHSEFVDQYDPAREARLYPDGPPFLAHYEQGQFQLGWIAALHGDDPATKAAIREAFTLIQPTSVLLEGFPTSWGANPETILEDIRGSEGPFTNETDLSIAEALRSGASVWGAELTGRELAFSIRALGFNPTDVFYTAFFGPLEQDLREGRFENTTGPAFERAFKDWAEIIAPEHQADAAPTPEGFRGWFRDKFGIAFEDDAKWWERGWPGKEGLGSEIARASNRLRDVHAYNTTIDRLTADRRVIVVFGGSHLSSVWRALEASMGEPTLRRFSGK